MPVAGAFGPVLRLRVALCGRLLHIRGLLQRRLEARQQPCDDEEEQKMRRAYLSGVLEVRARVRLAEEFEAEEEVLEFAVRALRVFLRSIVEWPTIARQ